MGFFTIADNAGNHRVGKGRFGRRLIFFLLLAFLVPALPTRAASPTPADILLVCNSAMKGSCEVARHYAQKRGVPMQNLVRLELPLTERVLRRVYETELAAPLRQKVETFTKQQKRSPVLLLVYGIPLKIAADPADRGQQLPGLAQARVAALTSQIGGDLDRLARWTGQKPLPVRQQKIADPKALFQRATEVIRRSSDFLKNNSKKSRHAFDPLEIQEVLLRLTGIAPAAESFAAQTEMRRPEARQLLGSAPVLQMHKVLQAQLGRIPFQGVTAKSVLGQAAAVMMDKGLLGELQFWLSPEVQAKARETGAAVDSELSLLLVPHSLQRWLPNPFFKKYDRYPWIKEIRDSTLLVARLDGPTPEIAKRLVDDAVEVEEKGLTGTFYIDARGLSAKTNYYGEYDQHLRNLAEILAKQTTFPVVFDDRPGLFEKKSCPEAALYCGWYSLARYQDSFDWRKGAVGFHVASSEAATLRQPGSQVWCKRMLEEGVAATLGPVNEPYLQSFPLPDKFFPLLMTGKLTLVEVYYRTLPFLSWRQILIGDPLYRPFRKNPVFTE